MGFYYEPDNLEGFKIRFGIRDICVYCVWVCVHTRACVLGGGEKLVLFSMWPYCSGEKKTYMQSNNYNSIWVTFLFYTEAKTIMILVSDKNLNQ